MTKDELAALLEDAQSMERGGSSTMTVDTSQIRELIAEVQRLQHKLDLWEFYGGDQWTPEQIEALEKRRALNIKERQAAVTMLEDAVRQMTAGHIIKISPET